MLCDEIEKGLYCLHRLRLADRGLCEILIEVVPPVLVNPCQGGARIAKVDGRSEHLSWTLAFG